MGKMKRIVGSKRVLAAAPLLALALLASRPAAASDHRDILWDIVSTCIDTNAPDYCFRCRTPRAEVDCHTCRNTIRVWSESEEYVALQDTKSCDCPSSFVHGLAIPRSRVTGFEDPVRPDGIWKFAWDAGRKWLKDEEIALAVNPKSQRSQDQLHVHIVRVMRERLPLDPGQVAQADSLEQVWYVAAQKAADLKWKDYGVLVTRGAGGKYLVIVDKQSPEFDFTVAQCRGPRTM